MNEIVNTLDQISILWIKASFRVLGAGSIVLVLTLIVHRITPKLNPMVRCWLWRIVYIKILALFFWFIPIELPLTPYSQVDRIQL